MKSLTFVVALAVAVGLFSAACSDEGGGPQQCSSTAAAQPQRAPGGDALCSGQADCSMTAGQPDHQGCPNTCSCLCHGGSCYEAQCTALVGCADPPVYR